MPPVIEVKNLRKTYGKTVAVDDVSFQVNDGEIFGLIGPNGAGKTTAVECLQGLRQPDSVSVGAARLQSLSADLLPVRYCCPPAFSAGNNLLTLTAIAYFHTSVVPLKLAVRIFSGSPVSSTLGTGFPARLPHVSGT